MTGPRRALVVLTLASLALSGCTQGAAPEAHRNSTSAAPAPFTPATYTETLGGIEGIVINDETVPLQSAQVAIQGTDHVAQTDAGGRFSLSRLEPGTVNVVAAALGHEARALRVEVRAAEVAQVRIMLVPLAVVEPHYLTKHQAGTVLCGLDAASPAAAAYNRTVSSTTGLACYLVADSLPVADQQRTNWLFPFDNFTGLRIETTWRNTQALGAALRIWGGPVHDGVIQSTIDRAGRSPLRGDMLRDAFLLKEAFVCETHHGWSDGGCIVVQHNGWRDLAGPSAPADAGFTFQQRFDEFATAFYWQDIPPLFTALADT